jgi:hypothetical protein
MQTLFLWLIIRIIQNLIPTNLLFNSLIFGDIYNK